MKFGEATQRILAEAGQHLRERRPASDPLVRQTAQRWSKLFAKALGKTDDAAFRR